MSDCKTPSLPILVQRFFVGHLGQHRAVSSQTVAAYRDTLRMLLSFAAKRLHRTPSAINLLELDAPLLLAFLDYLEKERGNSVRSRNARLAAIRTFLKYAGHHDINALATIERALAIPQKRFDRPMVGFLSRDEIGAIIEAPDAKSWAGQRDRAMFSTLYNTGARVSEIIGARWGDVVLEGRPAVQLHGKGRKDRTVPLWRTTTSLLRSWHRRLGEPPANAMLFPNRSGERMTRSNVSQRLQLAVNMAASKEPALIGRAVTPHVIRHTTAMHLLQSGVDITIIALWLGHEDTATTHMYVEADLTMKEQALMKLQPTGPSAGRFRG
ncbi:integrase [Brucella anthropi]|uniref:tyrosine-type recombinase/integrase n=1 Tax=Brucella anthropi TaxID=529 RepID=UPI000F660AF3|nr:tyrosine-type recombinase/integrase [Brucella anthropi]RRY15656.1 integrase [Brucella anthropi]